jgi:predicted O-methyltransferase YrrM
MNARALINEILQSKQVIDEQGRAHPLNSTSITEDEGLFLEKMIDEHGSLNTIEIGFAYGLSSLFICAALEKRNKAHHTIIDPSQKAVWNNIGVANLKRANIDFYTC